MPTYEYRCDECEHQFEVFQKMSDDPVEECESCGSPVRRLLFPVAIHFKGSGFYTTDYARKKCLPASNGNAGACEDAGSASGDPEAKPVKKSADAAGNGSKSEGSASSGSGTSAKKEGGVKAASGS